MYSRRNSKRLYRSFQDKSGACVGRLFCEHLEPREMLTSFVVTTVADSGNGSLRNAMNLANNNPGLDTIAFSIDGPGPHTIAVSSELPTIRDAVIIDGTTEPDFHGTPVVELTGRSASGTNGLVISSSNSTVRGLAINDFTLSGIKLQGGGNNLIEGNFIGTDTTGTISHPNATPNGSSWAVHVVASNNNRIGGTATASRNLISGNRGDAILVFVSSGNIIQGNYIGVDASGMRALSNTAAGIRVDSASDTLVGGVDPGAGNLISANESNGVFIVNSSRNTRVQGNLIGTTADGIGSLGNQGNGVRVANNLPGAIIGGTSPGSGNTIAYNHADGVAIGDDGTAATKVTVLGNSIYANDRLGINLGPASVADNDPKDADTGANDLQNYPVLIEQLSFCKFV